MAAGPCRSGREGASRQALEVEWQGQNAQQPAPRFSPWQGSLFTSRGGHGLPSQEQAQPGAGQKGASDGQPGVGIPGARPVTPVLKGPGTGSHPLCFLPCITLSGQEHLGLLRSQGTPAGEGASSRLAVTRVWPSGQAVRWREFLSCLEGGEPSLDKLQGAGGVGNRCDPRTRSLYGYKVLNPENQLHRPKIPLRACGPCLADAKILCNSNVTILCCCCCYSQSYFYYLGLDPTGIKSLGRGKPQPPEWPRGREAT